MILAVISYHRLHHHYFFIALYGFKLANCPSLPMNVLMGFSAQDTFFWAMLARDLHKRRQSEDMIQAKSAFCAHIAQKLAPCHNAHSMFQCASWAVISLTCSCRVQCWREPPPLKGGGWMWRIKGSWGRNNMGTSPPWVSGSLDRLVNIGAQSLMLQQSTMPLLQ